MTSIILGAILVAGILVVLILLVNKILTNETLNVINGMLDNLEYFIGSDNLTLFLCLMTVILAIAVIRFLTKFFHVNNE